MDDRAIGGEVVRKQRSQGVDVAPRKHTRSLAGDCWLELDSGIQTGVSRPSLVTAKLSSLLHV